MGKKRIPVNLPLFGESQIVQAEQRTWVEEFTIYCDGACQPNPGHGGWGAVILRGTEIIKKISGDIPDTTNQRMEIEAAIRGLMEIPEKSRVAVWSDSLYLVNTMMEGMRQKKNRDCWARLREQVTRMETVRFLWVRGHNGHPMNELADRLAEGAIPESIDEYH